MSGGTIEFQGVWKKFRRGELHDSLRDLLPALARRWARRSTNGLDAGEFWALRDVSFVVPPGKALGIIGANGAGKSTTLKVLTRILRPTRGHCSTPPRLGSLIEIGAGFHPDLTGRENVFLQGAILGMRRAEIVDKFDEIVAFAELDAFIDTPVKRYSSGMNARLGFAIAAHLDPDALLIDEVLSVGDYAFQQRAFDRIREMVNRNIPVVIVSHQLERIAALCNDAILLERGSVAFRGPPADCIAAYVGRSTATTPTPADAPVRLQSIELRSGNRVPSGERVVLAVRGISAIADVLGPDPDRLGVGIRLRELKGGRLLCSVGTGHHGIALPLDGEFELSADLQLNVPPGIYALETVVWNGTRGSQAAGGPSVTLQVEESVPFTGSVQLNPRVALSAVRPSGTVTR